MNKVKIKNTSNFIITLILNNVRYRRDLQPGQECYLADDVFEEFNFDPGCRSYVRSGYIKVITDNPDIKEVIEVAPSDAEINIAELFNKSPLELRKALENGSPSFKDKVVQEAMRLNIADPVRVAYIKQFCGVDIINALALQHSIQ